MIVNHRTSNNEDEVALQFRHSLLLALVGSALFLYGCQAEAPASKQSSTHELLAQVEAIEADESALLFQQAKAAAEEDNVKVARSLIQQALGRGAGTNGMAEAEAEIKNAEARIATRIAEQKRQAEASKRAQAIADEINALGSSSSASPSSFSDSFCWSINNDDARYACLNKPYQTRNEDARRILLGNCYSLSRPADSQGFTSVCARGKSGCYSLKNQSLHYPCTSCDGSKQWAATAVAGSVFQCR
mgnify:CR=1 FL=1